MQSAWSEADAQDFIQQARRAAGTGHEGPQLEDLALRVYSSRLIGADASLVLHGGGNTSVKTHMIDDTGELCPVLCVKGSGWDLGSIEAAGFPALRLDGLMQLLELPGLSDEDMVNAARIRMLDSRAPNPSVEVLLHAFLPAKFIDHSHADAILALVDQPQAEQLCRELFGDRLAVVPYVMPGFELAKRAAEIREQNPDCEGLVLLRHGLFTWGDTARESYERHIHAVDAAEAFLARHTPKTHSADSTALDTVHRRYRNLAPILRGALNLAPTPLVLHLRTSAAIRSALADAALGDWSQRGPATPDHVIRTKPWPLLLPLDFERESAEHAETITAAVQAYRARYREYFGQQTSNKAIERRALDPEPRVALIPGVGIVTAGAHEKAAIIAADIYEHTLDIIAQAEQVGRYTPLELSDLFDMEYWSLEQAKLGKAQAKALAGKVVIVSGAASGIGRATAIHFHGLGAHLVLVDRAGPALQTLASQLDASALEADLCAPEAAQQVVDIALERFGGLDGLVSNAGDAPQSAMSDCPPELLRASLELNLLSHQWLAAACSKVMQKQGRGGFLLFNASKAAFNPGPGFGPYAIAKAGLIALTKQYALEGGAAGIRSNAINADRIRTGLFAPEVIRARAQARNLEPDDYFKSNLLGREVTAEDVARAFAQLALAEATTGAVLTVDGGNIAASPR